MRPGDGGVAAAVSESFKTYSARPCIPRYQCFGLGVLGGFGRLLPSPLEFHHQQRLFFFASGSSITALFDQ